MFTKYIAPAFIIGSAIVLTLWVISFLNINYPVTLTTTTRTSEFSVVGEGRVEVVPDTAYVDLGIMVNNAATVAEAQKEIDATNNKIIESMKKIGIAKGDIRTSNYSLAPNYVYEGSTNRIAGYNGNVTVTVKTRDPQKASQIIEEATAAGANQVQGSRFVVDTPEKYRKDARDKAIANAREQADLLAKDLGIRLGKITNIVESTGTDQPRPVFAMADSKAVGMGGGGGPAVEPGTQTITSVVTLFFEKR